MSWVYQPAGAESAVPAVGPIVVHRDAETPRAGIEEPLAEAAVGLLLRCELVGGHRPHALRAEDAASVGEQHPGERQQVVSGRDQSRRAVVEPALPAPDAGGLVPYRETLRAGSVGGGQPVGLRCEEGGVTHT